MTLQRHDTIIYKKEEQIFFSQPLEKYFEFINKKPNFVSLTTSMTSRGYYADWKIENNRLLLINFIGYQLQSNWTELEFGIKDLFTDTEKPIFADWFSGSILLPNGENISDSIYPLYESFIKLTFDKGFLIKEEVEANDPKEKTATNIGIANSGA